jgi:hypothetical protein
MEPISTVILLASLVGLPITTPRSVISDKRERVSSPISTFPQGFVLAAPEFTSAGVAIENGKHETSTYVSNVGVVLAGYENLEDGWDGEGSVKPTSESVRQAIAFVSALPSAIPIPKAMIASDGQIGLYWDTDVRYADINFDADGTISLYTRDETLPEMRETYVAGAAPSSLDAAWLFPLLDLFSEYKAAA